jgi:hypothetical protein
MQELLKGSSAISQTSREIKMGNATASSSLEGLSTYPGCLVMNLPVMDRQAMIAKECMLHRSFRKSS